MCGIVAYTGTKKVRDILISGLSALEYRGYDSAGMYISGEGAFRSLGKVSFLDAKAPKGMSGTAGIAHTRWATHGVPSERNSHPHTGTLKTVWAVHNGIIENYSVLKDELVSQGCVFASDTDTEVIPQYIEVLMRSGLSFEKACRKVFLKLHGTYSVAVMSTDSPGVIVVARKGSPLVLGIAPHGAFVASDVSPIAPYTKKVLYLEDGDMGIIHSQNITLTALKTGKAVFRKEHTISGDVFLSEKNGYEHFMEKEIMEGPDVVSHTLRGRINTKKDNAVFKEFDPVLSRLKKIDRLVFVGCGTAYYAGLVAEYLFEEHAGIPVEVEIASELRYRKPVFGKNTALVAISQSGETADTLEAVREAKRQGVFTFGVINTVGSSIAREVDVVIHNHIGPELGVASTKAFISQVVLMVLLAVFFGRKNKLSSRVAHEILSELLLIPKKINRILLNKRTIKECADLFGDSRDMLYLGRKYLMPIALEGALKLKEISYIHAEGYGAGEMKHGPLAMIDEHFPTIALVARDSMYEKNISNIQEIQARKGEVIAVATEGDKDIEKITKHVLYIPKTLEMLSPLLAVVPLQLFAYYVACKKGFDVDRPRNLAKSVTVE